MSNPHFDLTLRATLVAHSALRAIKSMRPLLGPPNGEVEGFEGALKELLWLYKPKPPNKGSGLPGDDELESSWDPEPLFEASRCQALLMEIIRRATHDWVLYRQHRRMELKALADQAYTWLFEEEPGHPAWKQREKALFPVTDEDTGRTVMEVGSRRLTSFISICEACNLDPEAVRERAREMTVESILRSGRHTERRRPKTAESFTIEMHSVLVDVDIDSLDADNMSGYSEQYESDYGHSSDNMW